MEIYEKQWNMTVEEALEYCYVHRDAFISDMFACGEDGIK